MRVKFLADVNFDRRIVDGVLRRESLVDFQTADEAELSGKSDAEVLEIAASLQRLLVTHDRKTMPNEFGAFASHFPGASVF
jgi:predicted nuclease of predicted toxin-antitoxin system